MVRSSLIDFILTVPEALPDALRIHVVGNQAGRAALAADFQRAAQSGKLRRAVVVGPLPELPQVTEHEGIGGGRIDRWW